MEVRGWVEVAEYLELIQQFSNLCGIFFFLFILVDSAYPRIKTIGKNLYKVVICGKYKNLNKITKI